MSRLIDAVWVVKTTRTSALAAEQTCGKAVRDMYESPITVMTDQITRQINMEYDNAVMKAVVNVGVVVDKEELLKALKYDRDQYAKGYDEGYSKAIDDFVSVMQEEIARYSDVNTQAVLTEIDVLILAERMKGGA